MNYKYTFLLVEEGLELVYYNLTQEDIYQMMRDGDLVLSSVTKIKEV